MVLQLEEFGKQPQQRISKNHPQIISISDLCFHLNRERSERSYNKDKYNMISITKLDFFQPIDKQEYIFPSSFQQERDEFGFAAEIWRTAATTNLRKSCSKNLAFLSIQAEFGQTII